ncbi:hypothetical protein GCM10017744_026670 [Streptomyces antimycoticus]
MTTDNTCVAGTVTGNGARPLRQSADLRGRGPGPPRTCGPHSAQFGELVRFSKHTVASVELGRRMPDESFVERAEEVLGNTARAAQGGPIPCPW